MECLLCFACGLMGETLAVCTSGSKRVGCLLTSWLPTSPLAPQSLTCSSAVARMVCGPRCWSLALNHVEGGDNIPPPPRKKIFLKEKRTHRKPSPRPFSFPVTGLLVRGQRHRGRQGGQRWVLGLVFQ